MGADPISDGIRSIAANVRSLREDQELSQEALAEAAGVDAKSVQLLESGSGNPTARLLIAIAGALGVQAGNLFRPAELVARSPGRPKGSKKIV
jgi:transcriptional regulator with XRE-family HTH domain